MAIRALAQKYGVIVMTDSDSAGNMIRAYIKKIVGNSQIVNVYIPCLKGKEKRKTAYSKEGFLGVEGMTPEIIIEALHRSGVNSETTVEKKEKITKTHLFEAGLSGCADSSLNRKKLLRFLNLPENLSPNAMLDILNNIMDLKEFKEVTARCLKEEVKS
mgnify:CR=1 FL=1